MVPQAGAVSDRGLFRVHAVAPTGPEALAAGLDAAGIPKNPFGWPVTEWEEAVELRPGLEQVAAQVLRALVCLAECGPEHRMAQAKLCDNPYWPPELAQRGGPLPAGAVRYPAPLGPIANPGRPRPRPLDPLRQ